MIIALIITWQANDVLVPTTSSLLITTRKKTGQERERERRKKGALRWMDCFAFCCFWGYQQAWKPLENEKNIIGIIIITTVFFFSFSSDRGNVVENASRARSHAKCVHLPNTRLTRASHVPNCSTLRSLFTTKEYNSPLKNLFLFFFCATSFTLVLALLSRMYGQTAFFLIAW